MIRIQFKNLEPSSLAREAVHERIQPIMEKFPHLKRQRLHFTLSMENSPRHPGPDLFVVKMQFQGNPFGEVIITKSATNLYNALNEVIAGLQEHLNRRLDKARVVQIKQRRQLIDKNLIGSSNESSHL